MWKCGTCRFFSSFVLLLSLKTAAASDVCFVGYVMDIYCIDRGTLLDKPTVDTLTGPDQHSVHCLVDVGQCRNSGFEVLKDPDEGNQVYCRAYTLDDNGNDMVIAHARDIGDCSTCSGGGQRRGYRATITGTLVGTGKTPLLAVANVSSADTGCPGGATVPEEENLDCTSGNSVCSVAHASFMFIAWGVLLPMGVISARLLKHRADSAWYKSHVCFQMGGMLFALIGWIIALSCFDVFSPGPGDGNEVPFSHGLLGMVVMGLGLLQPLNACLRPPLPPDNEAKPFNRRAWEIYHKAGGYGAIILAMVTIIMGTTLLPTVGAQRGFQITYGCVLVCQAAYCVYLIGEARDMESTSTDTDERKKSRPRAKKRHQEVSTTEDVELHTRKDTRGIVL